MRLYELLTERDPKDDMLPGITYDDEGKMYLDKAEYQKMRKLVNKERGNTSYNVDANFGNKHKDFYLYVDQIQDTFEKTVAPLRNNLSNKYVEQWSRKDLDQYQTRLDGLERLMSEFIWRVENARQETPDAIPQEGTQEIEATYNRIYQLLIPKVSSIHDNKTLQKHGAYYSDASRTTPPNRSLNNRRQTLALNMRGRTMPSGEIVGDIKSYGKLPDGMAGGPEKEPTVQEWKQYFRKIVAHFKQNSQIPQPPKKNVAWYNNRQIQPIGNNPPMKADQEPIGSSNPKNLKGDRPKPGGS